MSVFLIDKLLSKFNNAVAKTQNPEVLKMWQDQLKEFRKIKKLDNKLGGLISLNNELQAQWAKNTRKVTYTKKQYNDFGWARANDIISAEENELFNSALADIKRGEKYERNYRGDYIIPVGEDGVLNKLVFTNGKMNNPLIFKVVEINVKNETVLSDIRSEVYENERNGNSISQEDIGLFAVHVKNAYPYEQYRRAGSREAQNRNGERNRGRGSEETQLAKDTVDTYEFSISHCHKEWFFPNFPLISPNKQKT